jgi:hypothetical protein
MSLWDELGYAPLINYGKRYNVQADLLNCAAIVFSIKKHLLILICYFVRPEDKKMSIALRNLYLGNLLGSKGERKKCKYGKTLEKGFSIS